MLPNWQPRQPDGALWRAGWSLCDVISSTALLALYLQLSGLGTCPDSSHAFRDFLALVASSFVAPKCPCEVTDPRLRKLGSWDLHENDARCFSGTLYAVCVDFSELSRSDIFSVFERVVVCDKWRVQNRANAGLNALQPSLQISEPGATCFCMLYDYEWKFIDGA